MVSMIVQVCIDYYMMDEMKKKVGYKSMGGHEVKVFT